MQLHHAAPLWLLGLLLVAPMQPAAGSWAQAGARTLAAARGFGGGGGSRSFGGGGGGTFRAASAPPRSATTTRNPTTSTPAAAAARPLPAGFTSRPGFRATPFLLPFGAGLLFAGAATSLSRDPNAYCNGRSITCYKTVCQEALQQRCPEAGANATLSLMPCPDRRFSECYSTPPGAGAAAFFECFGTRRPRYGNDDVSAVCHQQDTARGNGASGSTHPARWWMVAASLALAAWLVVAL